MTADSGTYDDATRQRRLLIAEKLLSDTTKQRPIRHWMEGVAQMGESAINGYQLGKLDDEDRKRTASLNAADDAAYGVSPAGSTEPATRNGYQIISSMLDGFGGGGADKPSAVAPPSDRAVAPEPTRPTTAQPSGSAPPSAPSAAVVPPNGNVPRGIRNNNPLNIEAGTFTQGQPGFSGSDGRFAKFDTPEAGMAAASKLLDVYGQKHGLNTINGIINRWAPASDGNNVNAYAVNVAKQIGVDPNAPLDLSNPEIKAKLIAAMGQHENGRPIGDVAGALQRGPNPKVAALLAGGGNQTDAVAPMAFNGAPSEQPTGLTPGGAPANTTMKIVQALSAPTTPAARGLLANVPEAQRPQITQLLRAPRGSNARKMGEQLIMQYAKPTNPTFGEIGGVDPQTGQPRRGWIDPTKRSVEPYNPPAVADAADSKIPPVPPGVDPKVWREAHSKRVTAETMPAASDDVSKLRGEIRQLPSYKAMAEVGPRYESMLTAAKRDNRAADLSLVYGLMKILDPTSVVRESEAAMAQNIATLPENYRAQVESFLTGKGRLSPEVRQAMMQEARGSAQSYFDRFSTDISQYRGIADRNRMNPEDVIPSFNAPAEFTPAPPAGAPAPLNVGQSSTIGNVQIKRVK